jgi:hypothetical protein
VTAFDTSPEATPLSARSLEQVDVAGAPHVGAAARSLFEPMLSTRTVSPYFSPNSIMAPDCCK